MFAPSRLESLNEAHQRGILELPQGILGVSIGDQVEEYLRSRTEPTIRYFADNVPEIDRTDEIRAGWKAIMTAAHVVKLPSFDPIASGENLVVKPNDPDYIAALHNSPPSFR